MTFRKDTRRPIARCLCRPRIRTFSSDYIDHVVQRPIPTKSWKMPSHQGILQADVTPPTSPVVTLGFTSTICDKVSSCLNLWVTSIRPRWQTMRSLAQAGRAHLREPVATSHALSEFGLRTSVSLKPPSCNAARTSSGSRGVKISAGMFIRSICALGRKPSTTRPPGLRIRASSADPSLRLCQNYIA